MVRGSDNHRSGSQRGTVAQTRITERANHGSSTRNSATARASERANHGRESATRHSQRVHHRVGTHRVRNSDGIHRENEQSGGLCRACGCLFRCIWAVLLVGFLVSSLLFVVLVLLSGDSVGTSTVALGAPDNNVEVPDNNVETLFAGQTLRIVPPFSFRTQNVRISVAGDPPASPGISADVFWSTSKCPSLKGEKVRLQHPSENDVPSNNYVYDHYNLNPGSRVSGTIHQLAGTTNFYLMKGADALKAVKTGKVDINYLEKNDELKFRVPAGSSTKFRYDTAWWSGTDYGDNVYTLVYDNQSLHSYSSFDVETDVTMTTHDMTNMREPYCDFLRNYGDYCPFSPSRSDCIIVKAFSDNEQDNLEVDESAEAPLITDSDSDRSISIEVKFYRDWKGISLYSTIPLIVSFFVCISLALWRSLSGINGIDDDEGDLTKRLLSPKDEEGDTMEPEFPPDNGEVEDGDSDRPPATAPQSVPEATPQSSAPIKGDGIVAPPESVEAV